MPRPGCVQAPDDIRSKTTELLRDFGVVETARRLGVSKPTVNAIVAETPITRGTVAIVRESLRSGVALSSVPGSRT